MELMISTLLICITLGIISFLYFKYVYKQRPEQPKPIQIPVVDFEKDIIFLNYIINHKIQQHKLFILDPMRVSRNFLLREEDFDKYLNQIIDEVLDSLSESYIKTLSKYFSEDGLIKYITEMVMKHLTAISVDQNYKTIKQRNAESLTKSLFAKEEKNNKGK